MIKRLGMALSAMAVTLTITGCAHPNADREGHLLGDINALKSVAANGTVTLEITASTGDFIGGVTAGNTLTGQIL